MLLSSGELKEVVFPCCSSFQSSISNIKKIVNVPMKKRELHVDLYFIAMLLSSGELKKFVFPCCSSFQSSISNIKKIVNVPMIKRELQVDLYFSWKFRLG